MQPAQAPSARRMKGRPRVRWLMLLVSAAVLLGCSRQEAAWQAASKEGTASAYAAYLEGYPAGAHAGDARQRLLELREQDDWERALRLDTPEAYQRHLAAFPAGRYSAAARDRLADFLRTRAVPAAPAAPPIPAADQGWTGVAAGRAIPVEDGGFSVQLGAFGSGEAAARAAWDTLWARHADLLGTLAPSVDAMHHEGRTLWRLRAGPTGEQRAREVCRELAARGTDCVVTRD